jgi:hypothetical protein
VDFLQPIFDGIPQDIMQPRWVAFLHEQGVFIVGITVLLWIPVNFMLRRWYIRRALSKTTLKRVELFGSFLEMAGILVTVAVSLYVLDTGRVPKPQEMLWREKVDAALHGCLRRYGALPEAKRNSLAAAMEKSYETPPLHCLSVALRTSTKAEPAVGNNAPPADIFRTQMRMAEALMAVPDVPDILQAQLSIDARRFLGYGYSLSEGAVKYSEAANREYFVRNRCASVGKTGPCADKARVSPQMFTWVLQPGVVASNPNETIGHLLARVAPTYGQEHYVEYFLDLDKRRLSQHPPVLIRFSKFSEDSYLGTVGRPYATFVFFSNLAEFWDMTVAQAELASGRVVDSASWGDPGQRVFIWVYFPSGDDEARLASWESVFYLLKNDVKVGKDVAAALAAQ